MELPEFHEYFLREIRVIPCRFLLCQIFTEQIAKVIDGGGLAW